MLTDIWGTWQVVGRELYDHRYADFDSQSAELSRTWGNFTEKLAFFGPCSLNSQLDNSYLDETENSNLATDPAHASLLAEMEAMLKEEVTKWIV